MSTTIEDTTTRALTTPFTLPSGATLKNRIAKAAMSEQLAGPAHQPTAELERLYRRWAHGGAGLLITGNVMIDRRSIGEAHNVVIEDDRDSSVSPRPAASSRSRSASSRLIGIVRRPWRDFGAVSCPLTIARRTCTHGGSVSSCASITRRPDHLGYPQARRRQQVEQRPPLRRDLIQQPRELRARQEASLVELVGAPASTAGQHEAGAKSPTTRPAPAAWRRRARSGSTALCTERSHSRSPSGPRWRQSQSTNPRRRCSSRLPRRSSGAK